MNRTLVANCSSCGTGLFEGDTAYEEPASHRLNFEDHTVSSQRGYVCESCHLTELIQEAFTSEALNRHAVAVRAVRSETGWSLAQCATVVREVRAASDLYKGHEFDYDGDEDLLRCSRCGVTTDGEGFDPILGRSPDGLRACSGKRADCAGGPSC